MPELWYGGVFGNVSRRVTSLVLLRQLWSRPIIGLLLWALPRQLVRLASRPLRSIKIPGRMCLRALNIQRLWRKLFSSAPFTCRTTQTNQKNRLVDYNATGSISKHSTENSLQNLEPMPNFSGDSASGDATKTYILRFVHKNAALLQNEYGFYVARRGTVLPDAGKVLSIKKLGDTWILTTATRIFYENHE